jgi:5-methylcytosine-specific restriction endonuclease McrA
MILRRYGGIEPSAGTTVPTSMRLAVIERDQGCVGWKLMWPGDCLGQLELDHVRASHGIGMKSATEPDNLVSLCSAHHRYKTEHGRATRPALLDYIDGLAP